MLSVETFASNWKDVWYSLLMGVVRGVVKIAPIVTILLGFVVAMQMIAIMKSNGNAKHTKSLIGNVIGLLIFAMITVLT